MQIQNLEINILYHMCHPPTDGTIVNRDLFDEFADIPQGEMLSAIDAMVGDGLVIRDASRTRLSVTPKGRRRLQHSVACRIHPFDPCRCGDAR